MDVLSLSSTSTDFTVVSEPPTDSEYDVVSSPAPSEAAEDSVHASTEVNASHDSSPTGNRRMANGGPSHALIFEDVNQLVIKNFAGGSIQRYQQMIIAELKLKKGLPFTAASAVPRPTELIGDQIPGYEAMTIGAKLWSWWTQEEKLIFDAHVVTEILQEIKEQQDQAALASNSNVSGEMLNSVGEEVQAVPSPFADDNALAEIEKSHTAEDRSMFRQASHLNREGLTQ